ncbi:MAG: hypothetical protein IPP74_08500 [Alphaproteobacteria bacterium]|nr:hypothetical protein [Alphaproteobacteria bacterium]
MRMVGFCGGSRIIELGSSSDMQAFFNAISKFVLQSDNNTDYNPITDRLYRRYLKIEELEKATMLMEKIKSILKTISCQEINFTELELDIKNTKLDIKKHNLFELFEVYFSAFEVCVESCLDFYRRYNENEPVKIIFTDTAWYMYESLRTLPEYDEHEGVPFWFATKDNDYGLPKPAKLRQ